MEDGSKLVHSKHFRWPDGSHPKNPHIVRMGVMFAILASVITIYLHLIPEADAVRASTPLMIIMGSIQVHNSAVYGLIAFCVFVVVSLIKLGIKSPHLLDPKFWPFIWWATIWLDTAFDVIYVVTVFAGRWDLFLGAVAAMLAIDGIILSERHSDAVAHIIALDVMEAFLYAGLTVAFTSLITFS